MWPRRCKHEIYRCLHGDEILETTRSYRRPSFARVRCVTCGKPLYHIELPEICTTTNEPHYKLPRKKDR